MSGNPLPKDRWAAVSVPALVMYGTGTFPSMIPAAHALADLLPTASLKPVEGENHGAPAGVIAAELRAFVGA
jgi:pimeloyl-ACP methyl ester carboxylesterase